MEDIDILKWPPVWNATKYTYTGETIPTEAKFETRQISPGMSCEIIEINVVKYLCQHTAFLKKTKYLLRTEVVFICLLIADLVSEKQSKILLFVHPCKIFTTVFCTFVSSFLFCSPSFVETNTVNSLDHMKDTFLVCPSACLFVSFTYFWPELGVPVICGTCYYNALWFKREHVVSHLVLIFCNSTMSVAVWQEQPFSIQHIVNGNSSISASSVVIILFCITGYPAWNLRFIAICQPCSKWLCLYDLNETSFDQSECCLQTWIIQRRLKSIEFGKHGHAFGRKMCCFFFLFIIILKRRSSLTKIMSECCLLVDNYAEVILEQVL